VNAGGISYASYRVTAVMEELAAFEPDWFVVYTGQNEFLERRTYRGLMNTPGFVRDALAWVGDTRTGTVLRSVLVAEPEKPPNILPVDPKNIAVDAVGPEGYHRDDEFRRQVVRHFRLNLNRMVDIAESAGARIVFVKPESNLVHISPFRSEAAAGLSETQRAELERLLAQGTALREAGHLEEAIAALRKAVALDGRYAEAQYQLGRALYAAGEFPEGHDHLVRARDEDICPVRAITPIVSSVAEIMALRKVPCIDFPTDLGVLLVEHGSPGRGCFYDHVHLTLPATRFLARCLAMAITGRPAACASTGTVRKPISCMKLVVTLT